MSGLTLGELFRVDVGFDRSPAGVMDFVKFEQLLGLVTLIDLARFRPCSVREGLERFERD